MKRIAIYGSTGSIGTQAIDIIKRHPDRLKVSVLTCDRNIELLKEQVASLRPELAVVSGRNAAEIAPLSCEFPGTTFLTGHEGLAEAAGSGDYDIMLNALTGISGLLPTWRAVTSGRDVALANKETLVAGGELVMAEAKKRGVRIIPVDSEHSAIFQVLNGNEANYIQRVLLTASGGPFRGYSRKELGKVTLAQALAHPNWNMGKKVTIDSATMMNKGLEMIEAVRLFDVPQDRIEVVVHPQSIIHSMVEYADGSVLAQMGMPDMRAPISYALSYPERWETGVQSADFFRIADLSFERPDEEVFSCLRLAREALSAGQGYPVVLNAANEALVGLFLENKIGFTDIQDGVERAMNEYVPTQIPDVASILELDSKVRNNITKMEV